MSGRTGSYGLVSGSVFFQVYVGLDIELGCAVGTARSRLDVSEWVLCTEMVRFGDVVEQSPEGVS